MSSKVNKNTNATQEVSKQSTNDHFRQSALQRAHGIIYGDREQTYGNPAKNLNNIAAYWSIHLNAKYGTNLQLTADDVSGMMILLKQARLANTPNHQDSIDDIIGYAALQDRIKNSL